MKKLERRYSYEGRRRFAGKLIASAAAITAMVLGFGAVPAQADTGYRTVSHVYIDLSQPGANAAAQYRSFIASLRAAAGHGFRGSVGATQTDDSGLIRADVNLPGQRLQVWLSPNNLYVRGFTTQQGVTYQFNDDDYDLFARMSAITTNRGLLPVLTGPNVSAPGPARRLDFTSHYNSLAQAAGRGRESMPISFNDLSGSLTNLANVSNASGGNSQSVARSLMFMIQFLSEAARFNDVYGVISAAIGSGTLRYPSLPNLEQRIENEWSAISRFAYTASNESNPAPLNVVGVGTLNNFNDVARYMAIIIGQPNQISPTGDWWHTEL